MIKKPHIAPLLLMVIFFNSVQKINSVEPPELTFVVKSNGVNNTELICIAEGNVLNSGIGWTYPLVETKNKLPEIVSSYVPDVKNDYDCNFSKTHYCSTVWKMEDWQYSKLDSYNFISTLDTRWEDFPTYLTSNSTKEFNNRVTIPRTFEIGFSVRAARNAEIFLCEGWNPHNHPCYYINVGGSDNRQAFLRKYKSIPEKFSKNDTKLTKYKSDVNILSEDEWKNFELSLDVNGNLKLREKNNNATLFEYLDKKSLHPIYFFIRSKLETALWKIHENHYIFTNKTKVTQLGPTFGIYGSNLCLSLYVTMCKHCKMIFSINDSGEKIVLQEVSSKSDQDGIQWKQVRLLHHNIVDDKVQLFVETKYVNNTVRHGFWAIDDVRVCAENEIKVTRLFTKVDVKDLEKSHFSCQALNFPTWRPTQHISSSRAAVEEIQYKSPTPTSIRLTWKKLAKSADNYQDYYLVQYEGKDICDTEINPLPRSIFRQKSQGYIIGKNNEIVLNNLIPYTYYNITLWNVIQDTKWSHEVSTLPTDVPTKEELPKNITMKITDTSNIIKWKAPKCYEIYGLTVYHIHIKSEDGRDNRNLIDIKTEYLFDNLLPHTNYSIEIITSRKSDNLNNTDLSIKLIYSFTTRPGIAPSVKNLELYATDQHSAQLRYDLPSNLQGIPKEVQIQCCHPLFISGCTTELRNLTNCKLWTKKYCIDIYGLIKGYDYKFMVSIKNDKTSSFGKQESILGTALDRVPGTPLNITYKMLDCDKTQNYCHLNISWDHPYNQNATITRFDVILNETSYSLVTDAWKNIHEILKIENKAYQSRYSCIIRYIPYSTPYKVSVRASNEAYNGNFASINIKTDDIGNYIDQTPTFVNCTNDTITFKLPKLDWRLNSSTLIVIAQDYDTTKDHISDEIVKLVTFENENRLCNEYGDTWVAKVVEISHTSSPIVTIGDGTSSFLSQLNNQTVINKHLKPNTEYCFTFTLINQYKNSENVAVYHEKHLYTEPNYTAFLHHKEKPEESTNVAAYVVPILFVGLWIACAIWFTYRYLKRRKAVRNNGEHIYESMPFEEYTPDAVSNQTYDRLIHD